MAHDLNKVLLIGNLTHDPEMRSTTSGKPVCGFRIATKRVWTTAQGEKQEQSQYHRIVAWGTLGDLCGKYLRKGRRVYVEGRLVKRK
jgi:single-strand DNA-binding protein